MAIGRPSALRGRDLRGGTAALIEDDGPGGRGPSSRPLSGGIDLLSSACLHHAFSRGRLGFAAAERRGAGFGFSFAIGPRLSISA